MPPPVAAMVRGGKVRQLGKWVKAGFAARGPAVRPMAGWHVPEQRRAWRVATTPFAARGRDTQWNGNGFAQLGGPRGTSYRFAAPSSKH